MTICDLYMIVKLYLYKIHLHVSIAPIAIPLSANNNNNMVGTTSGNIIRERVGINLAASPTLLLLSPDSSPSSSSQPLSVHLSGSPQPAKLIPLPVSNGPMTSSLHSP